MRRLLLALLLVALSAVVVRGQLPCDVLATQPSCDVALLPGPTENTLDIVAIAGHETFPADGQLRLTTVAVDSRLDFMEWVAAMFSSTTDTVDRDTIYPPGRSEEEVSKANEALMANSQTTATVAGLVASGEYEADDLYQGARIVDVSDEVAAEGVDALAADDVIVAVDGTEVDTADEAVVAVSERSPGDEVVLTLADDREVPLVAAENPDRPGRALLGLVLQDAVDLPFDVQIDAGNIGGPSAGLMFALGIVELLGEPDLTGGKTIAGTGTITVDGQVGPIGGIRQKVVGATSPNDGDTDPAAVFLVPRDNLAEAQTAAVSRDVLLVPVSTIDEALAALDQLATGGEPAGAIALGP